MIGDVIKSFRAGANLTQQELADLLGIKRSTYAYYELGKVKPPLIVISRLSLIYGVSVDTILLGNAEATLCDGDAPQEENDVMFLGKLSREERELIIRLRLSGDNGERVKGYINELQTDTEQKKEAD